MNKKKEKGSKNIMNTYIAIRPYIAQQIVEQLKKLPYNEVSGIINEIGDSMNYPVQLNWNQPVGGEEGEKKEEQKRPIGFRCVEEEVEGDDGEEGEPDEPTIVCKPKGKGKGKKVCEVELVSEKHRFVFFPDDEEAVIAEGYKIFEPDTFDINDIK